MLPTYQDIVNPLFQNGLILPMCYVASWAFAASASSVAQSHSYFTWGQTMTEEAGKHQALSTELGWPELVSCVKQDLVDSAVSFRQGQRMQI